MRVAETRVLSAESQVTFPAVLRCPASHFLAGPICIRDQAAHAPRTLGRLRDTHRGQSGRTYVRRV